MRFLITVIDTPDPRAAFYAALLDGEIEESASDEDWVQLEGEDRGVAVLAFQRAPGLTPPEWPGDEHPMRVHVDVETDDLDAGQERVVAIGGRVAEHQPSAKFRVFLDPLGHPFCLVLPREVRRTLV